MTIDVTTNKDIVNDWLTSGQAFRICGQDLRPVPHGVFADRAFCIIKGQAEVYFLEQVPHGNIWLLKVFAPGRRPTDDYLGAVSGYLPGTAEFFTCTQRRLLTEDHMDLRNSGFRNPALARLTEGAVMMPKVPGTTWASIADDLRDGTMELSYAQRLRMGLSLAKCISMLEAGQCSHRDLSSTNVFFDENGRAYLIDWDCLYHPQLPFQPNTTVGTMGYMARFIAVTGCHADATLSWCASADRFALAVLIVETLLVGPETASPHEDGSLFSQAQIDTPGDVFVRDQIKQLERISKPCAALAEQAFNSPSFAECPSPGDWVGALKYTLRKQQCIKGPGPNRGQYRPFVRAACSKCDTSFKTSEAKVKMIEDKGQELLCRSCLKIQMNEWSAGKAQRNMDIPQVCCEHCQGYFRLEREKLDALLAKGKPILCAACLGEQLRKWRAEHDKKYTRIACAECGTGFNMRIDKLNDLKHKGKQVLCRDCLGAKFKANDRPKTTCSTQRTGFVSSLWKLIRRTANGHLS